MLTNLVVIVLELLIMNEWLGLRVTPIERKKVIQPLIARFK